jgi:hypothetical protein
MAKYTYTAATLPAGTTARDVLEHVDSGALSKAQGVKFLRARCDAKVAAGRRPTFASRKALETLEGKAYAFDADVAKTRKQARKAAEPKAAKPAKRKAKASKAQPSLEALTAQLAQALEGADEATMIATFTALATNARK